MSGIIDIKGNVTATPAGTQEGATGALLDELNFKTKDKDLVSTSDEWLKKGLPGTQILQTRYKQNKSYYLGTQLGESSRISDNRIFLSLETIIPIATSSLPVANVLPAKDTIESRQQARNWEKLLIGEFRRQKVQKCLERSARYMGVINYFVLKTYYCPLEEKIKTTTVHPKDLIFDNERNIDFGFNWIGEKKVDTAERLIELFSDKEAEIKEEVSGKLGTEIIYTEFWTPDFVFWRFKDVILRKVKNPNWNHKKDAKNFFLHPKMPYIVQNLFDLGETISGETSLVDQAKSLQDGVNKRKNQIDANAGIVNGKVIATGQNGLQEKDLADVDWMDPQEYIFMAEGETSDINRVTGSPLPQFVESDMQDSRSEIDNVMGTHGTTRGERQGRETAKGREFLREGDRGRIDMIGRKLEEAVEKLFEHWVQLISVWYKKKELIRVLNKDNIVEFMEMGAGNVEDGMLITVIPGTLIPEDKVSKRASALQLAQVQMMDPITLMEVMGIDDPKGKAERLFKWNQDPASLFDEAKGGQEGEISRQVQQAEVEMNAMSQGQPQPPFEEADGNHIASHTAMMESPKFKKLPKEIQQLFLEHVQAEVEIVEGNTKKKI